MGGADKPLLTIGGRTLLEHVTRRLSPQCGEVIISANGNLGRFEGIGLPVVPDSIPGHAGPLAGILAALEWAAAAEPSIAWVVSAPCDTPFLPGDLVSRLHEARAACGLPLACASSTAGIHHAVGLWPVALRQDLRDAIATRGVRSIRAWTGTHGVTEVFWTSGTIDPFHNINTPDDLADAEASAGQL
jgi:molybdopterin-guanine dinucleotide biosynthesis protein A